MRILSTAPNSPKNSFCRWSTEDVFRLYSLTEGLYALIAEAEGCGSFGEYLENVCNDPGSAFMTLVPSWLNKVFRAPEA